MDLSLAFLMTEANRYADAAKRILLEIVSWPTDDDDVTSVSARWGDEPGPQFFQMRSLCLRLVLRCSEWR